MTKYNIARKASRSSKLSLGEFPQFAGTGVVPVEGKAEDLAVAVYVTCAKSKLSRSFMAAIPPFVEVKAGRTSFNVPTKIVNVGELEVSL